MKEDQKFWNNKVEKQFFQEYLYEKSTNPEKLFYVMGDQYLAYIPKNALSPNYTLQSRNTFVGSFTERWCKNILQPIAKKFNMYAITRVECPEAGLSKNSNADIAFCIKDGQVQSYQDIKIIFEVKMSILSNYEFKKDKQIIKYKDDYTSHKGTPSLLRSDSMLKAIGKLIGLRVFHPFTNAIPCVVLGNSPITRHYEKKVDSLKQMGVIQGFLSLNPSLLSKKNIIKQTPQKGFQTMSDYEQLESFLRTLILDKKVYFSAMIIKEKLGHIISISNTEKSFRKKAEKFLKLI